MARELLGKVLAHRGSAGIIVETEAYLDRGDGASHFSRGVTPRTQVIFGPPGHAYVYFVYGMYDCFNVVCSPDGTGGAVLVRAVEPVKGIEAMRRRRPGIRRDEDLANGPAKLTQALGIKLAHNGSDLTKGPITIHEPDCPEPFEVAVSPRIGIRKSAELPLRFFVKGNRWVSRVKLSSGS
jgi:DNA-3-methyladenine glycosylase